MNVLVTGGRAHLSRRRHDAGPADELARGELQPAANTAQVDHEPQQYSQRFPQNQPYWALFVETNGKWASAAGGITDTKLHDSDALGWHYVSAGDSSPAPPPLPHLAAE